MPRKSYQRYIELGGIINEKDYQSALDRIGNTLNRKEWPVRVSILQAMGIAEYARIELSSPENDLDPRVALYVILRNDVRPESVKYHHGQMSDQCIFGEVLRILEDADSLDKLIKVFPNISFKY